MSARAFAMSIARTDFGQRTAAEKKLIFSDYQMWNSFNYSMSSVLSGSPRRSSSVQMFQVLQVLPLASSKEATGFHERDSLLGRLVGTQMARSFAQVKIEAHVNQKAYDPTNCRSVRTPMITPDVSGICLVRWAEREIKDRKPERKGICRHQVRLPRVNISGETGEWQPKRARSRGESLRDVSFFCTPYNLRKILFPRIVYCGPCWKAVIRLSKHPMHPQQEQSRELRTAVKSAQRIAYTLQLHMLQ